MPSHTKTPSGKDREASWIRALHCEVRQLFREQRFRGRRPSIRILDSRGVWGRFRSLDWEIGISRTLVEHCPWWVVVEILKHEVAHLLVHAAFPNNERPHNHRFSAVCENLNVAPWARRATIPHTLEELSTLFDWRRARLDERTEKYRERLRKLLALAESTNEHEALVAMRRASELREQHRLGEANQGWSQSESGFVNLELSRGKRRHAPYQGLIASILINEYQVDVVFATRYNPHTLQNEAVIDLMGRPEDVLLAEYAHEFLHHSARKLWQEHRGRTGAKGLRARNSFIRGLLVGFRDKLERQNSSHAQTVEGEEAAAMVRAEDRRREAFRRRRYPRLVNRRSSAQVDAGAFLHGKREGTSLSLRKPIRPKDASPKQLSKDNSPC